MKTIHRMLITAVTLGSLTLGGCTKEPEGNGTVQLQLTDAPAEASNIAGVFITITGIEYDLDGKGHTYHEFAGPLLVNLLDLHSGRVAELGRFACKAGSYSQIRFLLDIAKNGESDPANPTCYIAFKDGTKKPLKVPSGSTSGYKGIGNFTVPVNGSVTITADFDVRKAVVRTGSGKYLLKPVIRLVVANQAGRIGGTLANASFSPSVVIHAYASDTYHPADITNGDNGFEGSITSAKVSGTSGEYTLPFLAPGKYDLIVVEIAADGTFTNVLGVVPAISVTSGKTTNQHIDTSLFY